MGKEKLERIKGIQNIKGEEEFAVLNRMLRIGLVERGRFA